jgi:hypothetical protein
MIGYKNKYLEMLKAEKSRTHPGEEPSKPSKIVLRSSLNNFEGFEPCGLCPTCRRGEFWRWPKYHKDHDPAGWICWFCSPPPEGSGPCDFCGVPEHSK